MTTVFAKVDFQNTFYVLLVKIQAISNILIPLLSHLALRHLQILQSPSCRKNAQLIVQTNSLLKK